MAQTPNFTAGTRPNFSVQPESYFFIGGDISIDPKREYQTVTGIPAAGSVPQRLYMEGWGEYTEVKFSCQPIPTAGGALQGLCAAEDAAILAGMNNLVDNQFFSIAWSTGTLVSTDPSVKRSRTGTGIEFTFNITHNPFM
jgi:hypothetical protein